MKYKHTKQDTKNDVIEIKKFTELFDSMFNERLILESKDLNKLRDYLSTFRGEEGLGATSHFISHIVPKETPYSLPNPYANIFIDTDINPNGVKTGNDHARTYSILYELKGETRVKYSHYWHESMILKFYAYDLTIEGVIEKFNNWLNLQNK